MGCWGLFADASVEQRTKKLKDTFALWKKQNNLMRHTFGDFSYYKKTYEEVTGLEFDFDSSLPTMKQLNKLEDVIRKRE